MGVDELTPAAYVKRKRVEVVDLLTGAGFSCASETFGTKGGFNGPNQQNADFKGLEVSLLGRSRVADRSVILRDIPCCHFSAVARPAPFWAHFQCAARPR